VLVIGLDLGRKSKHQAVGVDMAHQEVFSRKVKSSRDDLERLLELADRYRGGGEIHVVMEATGMSWFLPAVFFANAGCRVYRVKADQAADFRGYLSKHTKTDQVDAASLARMRFVQPHSLEEVHLRDRQHFALKQLIKQREDFLADAVRYKNRLKSLFDGHIPGLCGLSNRLVEKRKLRSVLPKLIDLNWVNNMGRTRFRRYIQRRDGDLTEEVIDRIYHACIDALAMHDEAHVDFEILSDQVHRYVEMLAFVEAKVDELTGEIEEAYQVTDADRLLCSIPGVGQLTAAYAEAYLAPADRFPNHSSADSWAGVIPKTSASGQLEKKGLKMSKAGPPAFRRVLYLAADVARRYDPQLAGVYHREMVEKGNPHTKAVVACMRRLLHRILRIMKDRREYQLRDLEDNPIDSSTAKQLIIQLQVPREVRYRLRQRKQAV